MNDYLTYAGTCKEACEALVAADSSLVLVRGYYECPMWGDRQHWWCKRDDGSIVDPTVKQFPTAGICATYREYHGEPVPCEECGRDVAEDDMITLGNFVVCSNRCAMRLVGL
jgi:hypothetical protein